VLSEVWVVDSGASKGGWGEYDDVGDAPRPFIEAGRRGAAGGGGEMTGGNGLKPLKLSQHNEGLPGGGGVDGGGE
jgi:hypothetical protein